MFYGQCNDCGQRWELGTARTCICEAAPVQEPVAQSLQAAVFTVLDGFTLPHDVRKILESAYYTTPPAAPAPKGMVLLPKRMTQAMRDVTDQEDWTWEDLLAAAEAITEDEYAEIAAQPAQRQWVGLTDEEIEKACVPLGAAMLSFTEVARAIEAKLKEKNNG